MSKCGVHNSTAELCRAPETRRAALDVFWERGDGKRKVEAATYTEPRAKSAAGDDRGM